MPRHSQSLRRASYAELINRQTNITNRTLFCEHVVTSSHFFLFKSHKILSDETNFRKSFTLLQTRILNHNVWCTRRPIQIQRLLLGAIHRQSFHHGKRRWHQLHTLPIPRKRHSSSRLRLHISCGKQIGSWSMRIERGRKPFTWVGSIKLRTCEANLWRAVWELTFPP